MSGETGKDVVNLCIQNLYKSGIFPDDHGLMRRIAHVMSNDGNPPFPLHTDGGIWQVSLFAFSDTHDTRAHVRLGRKYGAIMKHFDIDWRKVERIDLAIPMYSAIAARLYLSNFAEFIPPEYSFEKQADYWWYIYMKDHESKRFMARKEFIDTVEALNSLQHSIVPSDEPKSKEYILYQSFTNCLCHFIGLPDFEESCSAVLPQEKLNITHLADVEEKLQSIYFPHSKWIKLCLNLGLYKHTLDTISDNFSKDASRCLTECLAKWLKEQDGVRSKGGGAYWSSLQKAVEKIGERWN